MTATELDLGAELDNGENNALVSWKARLQGPYQDVFGNDVSPIFPVGAEIKLSDIEVLGQSEEAPARYLIVSEGEVLHTFTEGDDITEWLIENSNNPETLVLNVGKAGAAWAQLHEAGQASQTAAARLQDDSDTVDVALRELYQDSSIESIDKSKELVQRVAFWRMQRDATLNSLYTEFTFHQREGFRLAQGLSFLCLNHLGITLPVAPKFDGENEDLSGVRFVVDSPPLCENGQPNPYKLNPTFGVSCPTILGDIFGVKHERLVERGVRIHETGVMERIPAGVRRQALKAQKERGVHFPEDNDFCEILDSDSDED